MPRRTAPERRFRRLFETAQDGILIVDGKTHKVVEANPYMAGVLGQPREELVGRNLAELGLVASDEEQRRVFESMLKLKTVRLARSVRDPAGGAPRELELLCNAYQEYGRSMVQCNVRDVTERNETQRGLQGALQQVAMAKAQLEDRVKERTRDLQQRNAELEAFSYSLSHDIRAPIRAIVAFAEMALNDFGRDVGPPATEYLRKAISAAQRLDRLVLDVLAFSRTTAQNVKPERIDVEALLQMILQERPEWQPPKASIIIETPLLAVLGDRASLTQCLTNLLDNAIKFVPTGVTPHVRIHTLESEGRVRLCVTDNGIGIPAAAQDRVFELFQRAHSGYEGFGVGLAIVRRAAARMHGFVTVSSEPGGGSTFCLDLPGEDSELAALGEVRAPGA